MTFFKEKIQLIKEKCGTYDVARNFDYRDSDSLTLTLRLLMSCVYMEHLFLMFLDHTQRRTTVGRTPLDE